MGLGQSVRSLKKRQLMNRYARIHGVNAPPHRAKLHSNPCARTRSVGGNQLLKVCEIRKRPGRAGAEQEPDRSL